jgi:hypothetical protein
MAGTLAPKAAIRTRRPYLPNLVPDLLAHSQRGGDAQPEFELAEELRAIGSPRTLP